MRFSKRLEGIPRYPEAERSLIEIARLSSNENPFGFSPKVKDAILSNLHRLNRYPDGNFEKARKIVADRFSLSPEEVVFGNGLDEIIELFCKVFIDEGEKVVVTDPCFPIYEIFSRLYGGRVVKVPLKDFKVDVDGMCSSVKDARAVFINNPLNPTGTAVGFEDIKKILDSLPSDGVLFLDEAYVEFMEDPPDTPSLLKDGYPLVIGRTLSKAYGLAGMRIGYALAHKEVVEAMRASRQPYSLGVLEEVASEAALSDEGFLKGVVDKIKKERKKLEKGFEELGLKFIKSQANFLLVKFGERTEEIYKGLKERGIFVRRMDAYGFPHYVRVSVGSSRENELLLNALRELL